MGEPKVSIITPAYNSGHFITETIESVLNQSYNNWEMIIVDDCSTDSTLQIVQKFVENDNRIVSIPQSINSGQIKARNIALEKADGRFIAFLDSDDIWKKDKLEKQIKFMVENQIFFSHTFYEQMNEESIPTGKIIKAPYIISYAQMLNANFIGCLTSIYDASIVGKMKMPDVGKRDDWACWLNILKKGYSAYCLPESTAYYRVRSHSLSGNKIKILKYSWGILRKSQNLSFFKTSYHFMNYLYHSFKKYYLK